MWPLKNVIGCSEGYGNEIKLRHLCKDQDDREAIISK